MRRAKAELYAHLVWATWDRAPIITAEVRAPIYGVMQRQASAMGCGVIAIGGVEDHVHVLLRFPPTVAIAVLVGRMKGASSHYVTQVMGRRDAFRWQGAYGAFTVSARGVERVRDYVLNQERHHRLGTLLPALEETDEVG